MIYLLSNIFGFDRIETQNGISLLTKKIKKNTKLKDV